MSWDIDLYNDRDIEAASFNYTHSTNGAIRSTGVAWDAKTLDGMTAAELREHIQPFLVAVIEAPSTFEQFNPDNGWGTVVPRPHTDQTSLLEVMVMLACACEQNPDAIVHASF